MNQISPSLSGEIALLPHLWPPAMSYAHIYLQPQPRISLRSLKYTSHPSAGSNLTGLLPAAMTPWVIATTGVKGPGVIITHRLLVPTSNTPSLALTGTKYFLEIKE